MGTQPDTQPSPSLDRDLTTRRADHPLWPLPGCPRPRRGCVIIHTETRTLIRDAPCNNWRCIYCRNVNAYRLRTRLRQIYPTRLLTLTWRVRPNVTTLEAYRTMSKALSLLMKRIKRLYPSATINYVSVCESTAAGWPHFHVLLDAPYIQQRKLSGVWRALTDSPIVDIRRIYQPQKTADYLTKYLVKAPAVPPKCKHFRASRKYLPPYVPKHRLLDGEPATFGYTEVQATSAARQLLQIGYILISASDPWPWMSMTNPCPQAAVWAPPGDT